MNCSLDDQPRDRKNTYRVWDTKFVVLPILIAVALIGMAITHPHASKWISDAVQAEFVGMDSVPDGSPPTRVAQPKNEVRTVKAY